MCAVLWRRSADLSSYNVLEESEKVLAGYLEAKVKS
jgi:hypothetical protein